MTLEHAKEVYHRIVNANGITAPKLVLDPDVSVNASVNSNGIFITAGMLAFVRDDDEVGLVLGHELAHYVLHHNGSTPSRELVADRLGAIYEDVAGYNHCKGIQVLYRFHNGADRTHPSSDERYNKLKCVI